MSKSKRIPIAVISGTSRGMGEAIAHKFLKEGYRVIGIDRLPEAKSLKEEHLYEHYEFDIRDFKNRTVEKPPFDPDIIIANAGSGLDEEAISVNLEGTIAMIEYYIQRRKHLKSIIISASVSGSNACEIPTYVASKAGIIGYMKNLAVRLGKFKIPVNSISAGFVETPFDEAIISDKILYKKVLDEGLFKQSTSMEEIVDWYWFIATKNKTMTGQDIVIDGGELVKFNFIESPEQAKKDYFFKRSNNK